MTSCAFCKREDIRQRSLYSNFGLHCVKDLYPVTAHHYLVIAEQHAVAMAQLGGQMLENLERLVSSFRLQLGLVGMKMQLFERGNLYENISARPSLDHAHVHIFLGAISFESDLPKCHSLADISDLTHYAKRQAYFYYSDFDSQVRKVGAAADVPSQFV